MHFQCKTEAQSLIHLFWFCRVTSLFWQEFKQWISTSHETAINDLSSAIVLGLKPYAFRKFAVTSYLPDTTFGYADLKRRLLGVVNGPSKNVRLAKFKPNSRGLVISYFYGRPSRSLAFFFNAKEVSGSQKMYQSRRLAKSAFTIRHPYY